ncbi:MAG: hypothetical protein MJ137_08895 [Clostridia bacterium]|nr:hypothetical protein [Clostridia bacterium]
MDNNENKEYGEAVSGDSLKDSWKLFGKGMGKSMSGLGKAILRSARAGIDSLDSKNGGEPSAVDCESLKSNWKDVGKALGETAESFGKALGDTVESVFDDKDR